MKVNKKVRREVCRAIRKNVSLLVEKTEKLLTNMENADTVETLMQLKRDLLSVWLRTLPIDIEHCYFCVVHNLLCDKCEYARYHGRCEDYDSDYTKLKHIWDATIDCVGSYYKGEKYG